MLRGHQLKIRHANRVNDSSVLGDEIILTAETGTAGKIYPPRLVEEIRREKEEVAHGDGVRCNSSGYSVPLWDLLTQVCSCFKRVLLLVQQAAKFMDEEAMHIVYTVCGEIVKPEFLMSLKSLYLFAVSGFVRKQSYYHIHVLSDGTMDTRDMAFLRPLSNFKASVHPLFPGATMLFKPCSTERIYLHQHTDFDKLDQVTSSFLW